MNTAIQEKYQKELDIFKGISERDIITLDFLKKIKNKKCDIAFQDINSGNFDITLSDEGGGIGPDTNYEKLYKAVKQKLQIATNKISNLEKSKKQLNNKNIELAGRNNELFKENKYLKNKIDVNKPKIDIADKLFEKYQILDLPSLNTKIDEFGKLELHKSVVIKNILNPLDFEGITDTDKVDFYKNFKEKARNIIKILGTSKIENIDTDVKEYVEKVKNILSKLNFTGIEDTEKIKCYLDLETQTEELAEILNTTDKTKLKEIFKTTLEEAKSYSKRVNENIIKTLNLKDENDKKKIELYLEFEEKLKEASKQLSIDTTSIAWHRRLNKSITDLQNSNESIENELKNYVEILNSFHIDNIYNETAINNIKEYITTIDELREKYNISEADNIISSIDKLINTKNSKVEDILSEKKRIQESYQQQINDANNKVEQYKEQILNPLQINNISESLHVVERYKEYSKFMGLDKFHDTLYSFQKYNEFKNTPIYKNVFEHITEIISNTELPAYIKNLIIFLKILHIEVGEFYNKFSEFSDYKPSMFDITALQKTINRLGDTNSLKKELAVNLHDLNKKVFFENFIQPNLGLFIDLLSTLYSYSNIKHPDSIEIVRVFHQKPKLKQKLHEIYTELQRFLLFEYDIQLKTVNIFIDNFDVNLHEMTEYSDVQKLPYYKEHIKKINNGVIYDLNSVGISSVKLNINTKPRVVYKQ